MHFLCLDLPDVVLFYFFKERGNSGRASSLLGTLIQLKLSSSCSTLVHLHQTQRDTISQLVCGAIARKSTSNCVP